MLLTIILVRNNADSAQHNCHNREQHHELEKNPKFHLKRLDRTLM